MKKLIFIVILSMLVFQIDLYSQRIKSLNSVKVSKEEQKVDISRLIPLVDGAIYQYSYSYSRAKEIESYIGIKKISLDIINNEGNEEKMEVFASIILDNEMADLSEIRTKLEKQSISKTDNYYFYIENPDGCEKYLYKNNGISYQRKYKDNPFLHESDSLDQSKLICMGTINIIVPAGRFNCWWFESEDGKIREYYSKGIGLVKMEMLKENFKDYNTVMVLTNYSFK